MVPPCFSMICWLTHNPRPVPTAPLVLKNGSNIRRRMLSGTPLPLSAIVTRIRCLPAETRNLITPRSLMASRLLERRLEKTCRNSPDMAVICTSPSNCFSMMACFTLILLFTKVNGRIQHCTDRRECRRT